MRRQTFGGGRRNPTATYFNSNLDKIISSDIISKFMTYSINNIFKISYIALAALILFALPFSFVKATDLGDGGYDYVDTSYPMTGGGYDYIDTSYPIDYGYTGGYYGGYGYTSYGIGGYSIPSYSYPIYSNGLSSSYINTSNIISNTNISSSYINTTNITNNSSVSTQPYYYYPQPTYYQQPQYISYQQPLAYNSAPYVSLSAVPYTGLDLGPVGTVFYWGFLILWCLAAAYLIAVKRVQNKILGWLNNFLFGHPTKSTTFGHADFSAEKSAEALAASGSRLPPVVISSIDPFVFAQVNRSRA